MRAFAVEVFDNIYVSLARYGWVNKVFEVLDVSFSLDGIVLVLKETDASIWALGTSFSATDPAPNTLLPPPFQVQDIAGLTLSSGSSTKANTEGVTASWTAATDPGVRESGGGIEIRYGLSTLDDTQWTSVTIEGKKITIDHALDGVSVPLHDGAARFYQEQGLPVGEAPQAAADGRTPKQP